ncbi:uncharacterized protein ATC70_002683 [Mucor velutinosus]|uniref:Uncharacterized protein n=1 Tax=Mucor velutinosus TaxID=708070 RepID=A0AAN7DDA8_9FUNG|nr:hypothetical protein ATC70_002683 [Mucor velutinosus]
MRGQPQGRGERTPTGENTHRTSSLHRYDEEIDYTLPPYSEVPPPPTYTKVISPDGDIQIDQSEHVLTSAPEASLQSRSSVTTATQDACNANNEAVNEENASRVENSGGVNSDSLNPPPRSGRQ